MRIRHFGYFFFMVIVSLALTMPICAAEQKTDSDNGKKKEEEKRSGVVKEIEEKYGLVEDEAIKARIENISNRLVAILTEDEKKKNFIFRALDEEQINAFALPDGHIYFFKGLIDLAKTDDQLASVMAHEMAHIIRKHSKKINKKVVPYVLGGMALALGTGEYAWAIAGDWLAAAQAQSYGRKAEEDADKYGLELMTRADFDPIGILQFMSFMIEEEKRRPELFQNYFFVHPFAHERLEALKQRMREMGYTVPDSLYRSYLESGIESREKDGMKLVDIKFGGDVLLTIAGNNSKELEERAKIITTTLDELLVSGARDFDFRMVSEGKRIWIQSKGRIFYEPTPMDIEHSNKPAKDFLKDVLKKMKRSMWEERIKRGI